VTLNYLLLCHPQLEVTRRQQHREVYLNVMNMEQATNSLALSLQELRAEDSSLVALFSDAFPTAQVMCCQKEVISD
jgi:hypothetical protein